MKKTKIVCTLGPSSREVDVLEKLIDSGMDVARLNFSHGTHDDHRQTHANVREASRRTGHEVAVLQDLQGPKIRVGKLTQPMELEVGALVDIVHADTQPGPAIIPTTYADLARDVHPGDNVLMDDGLLRLRVEAVEGDNVRCRVEVGGTLKDRKGINLPGVAVSAPALTDKDLNDIDFGVELGVDFVCLSFVRSENDIALARERLDARGHGRVPVIAKIEKPQGVASLISILEASDGIMVARGDLGVEMGPEKVPLIQKQCIEEANRRGKLVITATQMLESMVTSSFPTRAEASDVANAVLDQTDAVMLSAETATGKHPALVVDTMRRIIEEVEASERYHRLAQLPPLDLGMTSNAIAHAAAAASETLRDVRAVVCISTHGIAPTLLSDYRPSTPIFALTHRPEHCRRLAAFWGVYPIQFDIKADDTVETVIERAEKVMLEHGIAAPGERVVLTLAVPLTAGLHTNTLKVHRIGGGGTKHPT